jgi:magnesium transporter
MSRHARFETINGSAMIGSTVTAGFMGTAFPLLTKRIGFEPATMAGPFETAVQEIVGFALFLWLASRLVRFLT